MKSLMLMSQRASLYDNETLLYRVALLEWLLDFTGQGGGYELLAFCGSLPRTGTGLESCSLHLSSHLYIKWLLSADFLLSDNSSSSLGESYKSLSICSQKYLWKRESLGRCCKLRVIFFSPSYLRRALMGERRGLELEEYRVILSQEIGWGMLFKWRLMLGKPLVCATCSGKRQDKVWSGPGGSNAMKAVDSMEKGWSQDTGVQLQLNGTTNNQ